MSSCVQRHARKAEVLSFWSTGVLECKWLCVLICNTVPSGAFILWVYFNYLALTVGYLGSYRTTEVISHYAIWCMHNYEIIVCNLFRDGPMIKSTAAALFFFLLFLTLKVEWEVPQSRWGAVFAWQEYTSHQCRGGRSQSGWLLGRQRRWHTETRHSFLAMGVQDCMMCVNSVQPRHAWAPCTPAPGSVSGPILPALLHLWCRQHQHQALMPTRPSHEQHCKQLCYPMQSENLSILETSQANITPARFTLS